MTFALIPAGGQSVRMGQPKLLLPFRGATILHAVVAAFRAADVERVLVVTRPDVAGLAAAARDAGAQVAELAHPTPDMRATLLAGLLWAEEHWLPTEADWWFLSPADHPCLSPSTVRELIAAATLATGASVLIPKHETRRGHPVLLRWSEVERIEAHTAGQGLNTYFRAHPERVLEVAVTDAAGFTDLNTPEEYQRLMESTQLTGPVLGLDNR